MSPFPTAGRQKVHQRRQSWQDEGYDNGLGMRSLAIDPTSKKVVVDLSGLYEMEFGFDPTVPVSNAEFVAREVRQETKSVENAKALGQHPNPALCHMCRRVKPLKPAYDKSIGFEWNPKPSSWPFGTWKQLKSRQHCVICRLILSLIVIDSVSCELHPCLAATDLEVQGTQLRTSEITATGEIVMSVEYGLRKVGALRIITEGNHLDAFRDGPVIQGQYSMVRGPKTMLTSEPREPATASRVNPDLLQRWFNNCELNHGETCSSTRYRDAYCTAIIPITLIDVWNNCLVTETTSVKYFALSYVWGAVDMLPTLLSNVRSRRQAGGLPQNFPKTIADTIEVVRLLGERYVWIDALCIVQDDTEKKSIELSRMDVIYLQAFATIVALEGDNANVGLSGVRPGSRPAQQVETLVIDTGSEHLDFTPTPGPFATDDTGKAILQLVVTPQPLHLALESSRWDSRGWTFQERILSRRCLYFSSKYVYFQCSREQEEAISECGVNSPIRGVGLWENPDVDARIVTSLNNPMDDLYLYYNSLDLPTPQARLRGTFDAYARLVEKYTSRTLTYESDIINAFLGVFAALNTAFQSDILCGLPAAALDLALLWTPTRRCPRRGQKDNFCKRPMLNHALLTNRDAVGLVSGPSDTIGFEESVDRRFPSWSWVGWNSPMEYRLFAGLHSPEPLPKSLIHEFAFNVDGKDLRTFEGRGSQVTGAQINPGPASNRHSVSIPIAILDLDRAENEDQYVASPSLPNVLQFSVPTVPLNTFTICRQRQYISTTAHVHSSSHQEVRHILDRRGKRCGLWWEQANYVYVGRLDNLRAESKMIFVAVSEEEDMAVARKGSYRVEGEIKMFDETVYPSTGAGSGLINVLVVDEDMGHEYGERVTVVRIHAKAWEEAGPVKRMVKLA
ncbi:HET-domain-containing protein [Lentithecium fluviatile CBS 122367]|uniref:HET-domain-containing protein n=1 Tax=Lentithecium fluviatile CBS 122367 TaxID=1168545 RepID=A0A6G1J4S2_9PLEO|nr:HET-domain-containing protein [Lentithecium fluviatile CBS 122367]